MHLDDALGDDMAQNLSKQEHTVWFGGDRAHEYIKQTVHDAILPGTTAFSTKYLGGMFHFR
eukprot:4644764-Pyramimonas_sp.AAC.1